MRPRRATETPSRAARAGRWRHRQRGLRGLPRRSRTRAPSAREATSAARRGDECQGRVGDGDSSERRERIRRSPPAGRRQHGRRRDDDGDRAPRPRTAAGADVQTECRQGDARYADHGALQRAVQRRQARVDQALFSVAVAVVDVERCHSEAEAGEDQVIARRSTARSPGRRRPPTAGCPPPRASQTTHRRRRTRRQARESSSLDRVGQREQGGGEHEQQRAGSDPAADQAHGKTGSDGL